jgi:hypothetical protein
VFQVLRRSPIEARPQRGRKELVRAALSAVRMTTWLDWRTEPVADVPEVTSRLQIHTDLEEGPERTLSCEDVNCGWWDVVFSPAQAVETIRAHKDWHENGMPQ